MRAWVSQRGGWEFSSVWLDLLHRLRFFNGTFYGGAVVWWLTLLPHSMRTFLCVDGMFSACLFGFPPGVPVSATIIKNTSSLIFSQCSRLNVLRKIWIWSPDTAQRLPASIRGGWDFTEYHVYVINKVSPSFSIWLNKLFWILSLSRTCDLLVERHF